jgi:hypothetical protein
MPPINSRSTRHDLGSPTAPLRIRRGTSAGPFGPKIPAALSRGDVWDHALAEPTPEGLPSDRQGMEWLALVARFGLALFFTAGFAAGLGLYVDKAITGPYLVQACGGFFVWVLALLSCVVSRDTR